MPKKYTKALSNIFHMWTHSFLRTPSHPPRRTYLLNAPQASIFKIYVKEIFLQFFPFYIQTWLVSPFQISDVLDFLHFALKSEKQCRILFKTVTFRCVLLF